VTTKSYENRPEHNTNNRKMSDTFTGACKPGTKDFERLVKKMVVALEESAQYNNNRDVSWLVVAAMVSLSISFVDRYNSRDESGRFSPRQAPKFVTEPLTLLL